MSTSLARFTFLISTILILTASISAQVSVTFKVDMGVAAQKGTFTPGVNMVSVIGSFNGWNSSSSPMKDETGDTVYSVKIDGLKAGEMLSFLFVIDGSVWEGEPNRQYEVPVGGGIYQDYWDRDKTYPAPFQEIEFEFSVLMDTEILAGRFDPLKGNVFITGDPAGWPGDSIMHKNESENTYSITKKHTTHEGEVIKYKYAYQSGSSVYDEKGEERSVTVEKCDIENGFLSVQRNYDDLDPNMLLQQPCIVKFTVSMKDATAGNGPSKGRSFEKIETVSIAGSIPPLSWPGKDWPDSGKGLLINLNDSGIDGDKVAGDQIWSKDIRFEKYSPIRFHHKYSVNYGLSSNHGVNDNESPDTEDHITFLPYLYSEKETVIDTFGQMGKSYIEEFIWDCWDYIQCHDLVIERLDGQLPREYSVSQNYPNPFNPSTKIQFSIPKEGIVRLKVYNMLGQEVETLLDSFVPAGSYSAEFDASGLNSGIYFYTIQTRDFVQTRKMLFVK